MHRLKPQPKNRKTLATDLANLARIGALFVDGDLAEDLFVSGAETWTSGDDINFNHGPFIDIKKTVLKVERIGDFRYFAAVCLVRKDDPSKAEAVVCGMRNDLGIRPVPMTAAMKRCVTKGAVTTEKLASGDVRAYAPLKNSDGEVLGFVTTFTALKM